MKKQGNLSLSRLVALVIMGIIVIACLIGLYSQDPVKVLMWLIGAGLYLGIILLLLALLVIPALISERKNKLYEAQEPERLKQHQARFYCHICGKPSPRPDQYWDQDGEGGRLYSEFLVTDYDKPTDLVQCARCQKWTCSNADPPHLENGFCKKCLENTPKGADTFTQNTPVNDSAVIPVDTAKVASLITDLTNSGDIESEAAAEAMIRIGVVAIEPLIARLQDSNWAVRASTALALGQIGDAQAVEALVVAIKDSEVWVRISAAIALGQIKDVRAVEALITAVSDSDRGVREEAVRALGQIGDVRAFEPLLAALKESDVYVRSDAVYALGEIKDARAIEPLGAFLKDNNRDVRENAAYALGKIGDARAIESLIFSLLDPDKFVRVAVTEALGQIGDSRAVEPLRATANNDDEPIVRSYAQTAINRIQYPDELPNDDD